jgi:predicted metalloprotease
LLKDDADTSEEGASEQMPKLSEQSQAELDATWKEFFEDLEVKYENTLLKVNETLSEYNETLAALDALFDDDTAAGNM